MSITIPPDEVAAAEIALARRMIEDAPLVSLLGAGNRIIEGWPADTLEPADFPRVTFFFVGDAPLRPGISSTRWQINPWVWIEEANGGRVLLMRLRARIKALFNEAHFTYGGFRLYSYVGGGAAGGEPTGEGLRTRPLDIIIEAS